MTATIFQASIDEHLEKEATSILTPMGLSISDVLRLLLTRIVDEKTLPAELEVPNAVTVAAMEAARRGEVEEVTLDQLAKEWNEK